MRTNRLSIDEIKLIMGKIKLRYNPDEDTMHLIETDLCGGMSPEDVYKYCSNRINFIRKKIISEGIRRGYPEDVIKRITNAGTPNEDLEVLYTLLEKGVSIAIIEKMSVNHEVLLDYANKLREGLLSIDEINDKREAGAEDDKANENNVEKTDENLRENSVDTVIDDTPDTSEVTIKDILKNNNDSIAGNNTKVKTFFDNSVDIDKNISLQDDIETTSKGININEKECEASDKKAAAKENEEKDNQKNDTEKSEYEHSDSTQQTLNVSDVDFNKFLEGLKNVFEDAIQKSYLKREESEEFLRKNFSEQIYELRDKLDTRDRFIRKQFKKINELNEYKKKTEELEYELKNSADIIERYKRIIAEEEKKSASDDKAQEDNISINGNNLFENTSFDASSEKNKVSETFEFTKTSGFTEPTTSDDATENHNDNNSIQENNRVLDIPVTNDKVIQFNDKSGKRSSVVLEYASRKNSGVGKAIAAFACKKRSRRSLVQLVIADELSADQLKHIVTAIKSGLTENQLCSLIENKVPAEKMPQIIEIAMLENKMGYSA